MLRKAILFFTLSVCLLSIVFLFIIQESAQNDYFYTLNKNKIIIINPTLLGHFTKPERYTGYFFHFTSVRCPYNGIGFQSLNTLYQQYHDSIAFFVIANETKAYKYVKAFVKENNMGEIVVINDKSKAIQKDFDINTFPRAVIIDKHSKLFYEGNYNHNNILCGFGNIDYGQVALNALIKGNKPPAVDYFVLKETDCH